MTDFRAERIGIANASRLLGVPVTELKDAVNKGEPLRGVIPPQPIVRAGVNQRSMLFLAGDVMDCAEAMSRPSST
ncbi:hypothetical protein [Billgrantia montanilacus]|uniref:DNA-binding protein n=1 Tax=Billgrantia montanilacus TaxID=2282305 RepID=A0A368U315_9GAMM|nr:hypothetical protein [Halomonas montanilacus]RCV90492.1 hypothetical protein DU505_06030 [Halomonas montanilacus]